MSARFRSPAAVAAVWVLGTLTFVAGVAGCASEGVVGGGAPSNAMSMTGTSGPTGSANVPQSPGSSGSSSSGQPSDSAAVPNASASTPPGPASSTAGSGDPSALASSLKKLDDLWTDPGCKIGLRGFGDYMTSSLENPAKGNDAIPGAIRDLRAGATTTKRPEATRAMGNMAKDLQAIADAAKAGQTADKGKLRNDWQLMGTACTG